MTQSFGEPTKPMHLSNYQILLTTKNWDPVTSPLGDEGPGPMCDLTADTRPPELGLHPQPDAVQARPHFPQIFDLALTSAHLL